MFLSGRNYIYIYIYTYSTLLHLFLTCKAVQFYICHFALLVDRMRTYSTKYSCSMSRIPVPHFFYTALLWTFYIICLTVIHTFVPDVSSFSFSILPFSSLQFYNMPQILVVRSGVLCEDLALHNFTYRIWTRD
uniref:uncharacterized protein LOC117610892 n=1 Tax=Osmia lignaria TaxID=473952 RepID=UPI00147880AC|nr:uncharacterized protein LOC117610892 [Osmia lignaria]